MTRFAGIIACLLITLVAACGDSSASAPSATPTAEPSVANPVIANVTDAIDVALGRSSTVKGRVLFAQGMTAEESATRTKAMGIGGFPDIMPAGWSCPPAAICPYPGEPTDEHGYLIVASDGSISASPTQIGVSVNWVSDSGGRSTIEELQVDKAAFEQGGG